MLDIKFNKNQLPYFYLFIVLFSLCLYAFLRYLKVHEGLETGIKVNMNQEDSENLGKVTVDTQQAAAFAEETKNLMNQTSAGSSASGQTKSTPF
tara:strand:+ start:97 stop:378 length:282 start_codon:yes stop_codon:yes gene_type:complete